MSLALTNRLSILKDRASMLAKARDFFSKRGVMETDVPILSQSGSIDLHIDLVEVQCMGKPGFLHSSPEYGMKRLLAEGIGDIFQLAHVFREGERGPKHNPEFVMAEWYRMGFIFEEMIEETVDFISLFLEKIPSPPEYIPYRQVFLDYLGTYPLTLDERDYRFGFEIEPHLGKESLTIILDFPPEQAGLSRINEEGLAERFEVFYKGTELANGYHELTDPFEQAIRLEKANQGRAAISKRTYPIDRLFLEALKQGIDDCCGVAVGVDRLMMLRHEVDTIEQVIPFCWEAS